jgi:hypothetical protein
MTKMVIRNFMEQHFFQARGTEHQKLVAKNDKQWTLGFRCIHASHGAIIFEEISRR